MKRLLYFLAITIITMLTVYNITLLISERVSPQTQSKGLLPVVRLVQKGRTYCSGVVIDSTTIVTASHCVVMESMFGGMAINRKPIEIRAADNLGRGTYGNVSGIMIQMDRAVIKGDFHLFRAAPYISDVGESISHRIDGEKMFACGYPLGGKLFCTRMVYLHDMAFMLAVRGVLIPGMSGGPTMLMDGTVIAINVAVANDFSIVSPIYNIDDEK